MRRCNILFDPGKFNSKMSFWRGAAATWSLRSSATAITGGHGSVDRAGHGAVRDPEGRFLAVIVKAGPDEAANVRRILRVDVNRHGAVVDDRGVVGHRVLRLVRVRSGIAAQAADGVPAVRRDDLYVGPAVRDRIHHLEAAADAAHANRLPPGGLHRAGGGAAADRAAETAADDEAAGFGYVVLDDAVGEVVVAYELDLDALGPAVADRSVATQ